MMDPTPRKDLKLPPMVDDERQAEIARLRAERDAAREEVERLRAALEPFALNAEAWTRSGFHPSETLTEGWPEMPMAADDEPSHFNGDFLEVRHLIAARAALQEGEAARATPAPSEGGKG